MNESDRPWTPEDWQRLRQAFRDAKEIRHRMAEAARIRAVAARQAAADVLTWGDFEAGQRAPEVSTAIGRFRAGYSVGKEIISGKIGRVLGTRSTSPIDLN